MSKIPPLVALPLVALVLTAAIYDIRFRRIPNWLNVSGVVAGVLLNALMFEWLSGRPVGGLLFSLKGFGLAFGLNFLFYLLRFTGAGDVKLMAAVGTLVGWKNWIGIFILNALLGGVAAMALVLARGRMRKTFFNVAFALNELGHFRAPYLTREELDVNSAKSMRLPRGAVIAAGTLAFLGLSLLAPQ
jgi:prepilin peptidase CpaA